MFACTLAQGATIVVTGVDFNRGESIWIREDGADVDAYFVGVIQIAVTEDGVTFNRDTVCVDLFTDINLYQTYNTTILRPTDVSGKNLLRASWLVDNTLLPTQNPGYHSLLPSDDWVYTPDQGAGLQLAIWDIVHDGGDGLSAGRVQAATNTPANVVYWADTYLGLSVWQGSALSYVYNNTSLTGAPAQMLIGPMFDDGGPQPNPEPSTLVLVGGALLGLGWQARRKCGTRTSA